MTSYDGSRIGLDELSSVGGSKLGLDELSEVTGPQAGLDEPSEMSESKAGGLDELSSDEDFNNNQTNRDSENLVFN